MMRTFHPIAVLMTAAMLAACVNTAPGTTTAGPGSEQVDGLFAGIMFTRTCIDTLPDFRGAPATLAGYRQDSGTGTYYHPNLDLSFKLLPDNGGTCSMVFASADDPVQIGIGILAVAGGEGPENTIGIDPATGAGSAVAKGGAVVRFVPGPRSGGRQYYRAFVARARG